MPNPLVAVAGIGGASSVIGASQQAKAAKRAGSAQERAAEAGIAEQQRQFDAITELMAPFVEGGTDAAKAMFDLVGLSGAGPQADAIAGIERSPELAAMVSAGEEALLQNASATGGLRGGNTARALAELRPAMLAQQIGTQYGRLGGLAQVGQAGAAQQAAASQAFGQNAAALRQQAGAAQAGAALGVGQAWGQGLAGVNRAVGLVGSQFTPPKDAGPFDRWGF